jgi:hypothetical protein
MLYDFSQVFEIPKVDGSRYSATNALLFEGVGAQMMADTLLDFVRCSVAEVMALLKPPFPKFVSFLNLMDFVGICANFILSYYDKVVNRAGERERRETEKRCENSSKNFFDFFRKTP